MAYMNVFSSQARRACHKAHLARISKFEFLRMSRSTNAETTPAGAPTDIKQRPHTTCEGRTGDCLGPRKVSHRGWDKILTPLVVILLMDTAGQDEGEWR